MLNAPKGTALITGASGGIGAIYADRLAREGFDLILVARRIDALNRLARTISNRTGCRATTVRADLSNPQELRRVETILRTDPSITMLVNNAGVGAVEPLLLADVDQMERLLEVNVIALMRLVYAAAPGFAAREHGTIVNLGSIVAVAPEILNGVYGASKAFVLALTLSLHKEFAERNVRVQAVLPGAVATDFWDVAGGSLDRLPSRIVMDAEEMVDAALSGLRQGELVTLPSLPDPDDWNAYEAARQKLIPNLSLSAPAARYIKEAFA